LENPGTVYRRQLFVWTGLDYDWVAFSGFVVSYPFEHGC
jgi:hypothetical protein